MVKRNWLPFCHVSCLNGPHAYIAPSGGEWNSHRNVLSFGLLDLGSFYRSPEARLTLALFVEVGGTAGGICGG